MNKIIILFFIITISLYSKDYNTIEGLIVNAKSLEKVYLYEYNLGKYNLIDTAVINNGQFKFSFFPESKAGIYKIQLTPFKAIEDILFNYENIALTCDLQDIENSLNFLQSNENKILNYYKKFTANELQKERAFLYLLGFYSPENEFYQQLNEEMQRIKKENKKLINNIIEDNKELLVSKYIKYDQLPDFKLTGIFSIDKPQIQHSYWDNIDFTDTLLLRLPIFDQKIENFLILVENDTIDSQTQERIFINSIDKLLKKAEANNKVYRYIALKLLEDAKNFQLFELYSFLATKLIERNLLTDLENENIRIELNTIDNLQIGKFAPNFNITNNLKLYDIKSNYILIFFWEADCNLCIDKLKALKELYDSVNNREDFEVVAINLNLDNIIYQKVLLENDLNWINFTDFRGWNSQLVKMYKISRTPAMILIDKNKKIISRPVKINEIFNVIKKG